jgi:uncharacterized membrane protein
MMRERHWPEAIAVLVAAVLYVTLPNALVLGEVGVRVAVPVLELVLIAVLALPASHRRLMQMGLRREVSIALIALIGLANAAALGFLIHQLLYAGGVTGRTLLYSAFDLWVTNVIVFALWYWELDGGGPVRRAERAPKKDRDFAFIQQTDPEVRADGWHPTFVDYVYVAFTNGSAFSPTDTMPLTHRAKMLMLLQSTVSMVTLLLVAARAVNILMG